MCVNFIMIEKKSFCQHFKYSQNDLGIRNKGCTYVN